MSKSVVNGELVRISPSSITAFDSTSRFGCERKWYFEYVLGYRSPPTPATLAGQKLHANNEEYFKKGKLEGEVSDLFLYGRAYLDSITPRIREVEKPIVFAVGGVGGVGYCDVVLDDGILDWKTTADVNKYGKTAEDLRKDIQMLIYAKAVHPDLKQVRLVHGQYQTSGRKQFRAVETIISREAIEVVEDSVIIPLVQKMKVAAGLKNVTDLPSSPNKCWGCAHKQMCPASESENALLKFFKKTEAAPIVEAEVAPVAKPAAAEVVVGQVLPPDAPKSDPAKAAEPVEGFQAVPAPHTEEEKRGRGRPKGSKNKMRIPTDEELPTPPVQEVVVPNEVSKKFDEKTAELLSVAKKISAPEKKPQITYGRVTVKRSVTIQPVQFNPVRFEVELEASVNGVDLNEAYGQMSTEAQRLVETDAEVFMANFRAKTGVK